ncbi:MAG: flagellar basal body-associated FliL family protein [Archangium sp.]|nr:flagellar basal body-associated FliL family protein [Archangium sp.]
MSDEKKAGPATPPPPASSKLMPILIGFNSLLLVGVLGFMGYQMTHPPAPANSEEHVDEAEAKPDEKAEPAVKGEAKKEEGKGKEGEQPVAMAGAPGPMVKLPDFVVHLRNPDLDRYARITFEVEVMAEPDKERLTANLPRVRDAFISYLSDRTVEELRGSEGLTRTKDALQQKLRELVPEARFRALYISDFVVQ